MGNYSACQCAKEEIMVESLLFYLLDEGGESLFGLGMPELILILVIALVVFGPSKLPELGSSVGKTIREFRKCTQDEEKNDQSITLSSQDKSVSK